MAALLALICFVLALFDVDTGPVDVLVLGLVFVALHLLIGIWPLDRIRRP